MKNDSVIDETDTPVPPPISAPASGLLPWPPPREPKYKQVVSPKLTQALVLLALSVSVIYLGETLTGTVGNVTRLLLIFLNNVLGLWLGYASNNYYRSITEPDPNRREALRLSQAVHEFLLENTTQTKKIINALRGMVKNRADDFLEAARYFMADRAINAQNYIMTQAHRIRELGFDSEKFAHDKLGEFNRLNQEVEELVAEWSAQNTAPEADFTSNQKRLPKPQK